MLGALLVFFWYPPNYDITFEITNKLKVNNNNLKFNSDYKSYTKENIRKTLKEHLIFTLIN